MRKAWIAISLVAVAATLIPSVLYLSGAVSHDAAKTISLVGTVAWFVATPLWVGAADADQADVS